MLLLLVPAAAAAAYAFAQRRPPRHGVTFTNLAVLESVVEATPRWRRHIPAALLLAAVSVLAIAAARPSALVVSAVRDSTVILVVDVSGSMRAIDVKPSRIGAARTAMLSFVSKAPKGLRIGVIEFSTEPAVLAIATTDFKAVRAAIGEIRPNARTAIGDALARAVDLARSTPDGGIVPAGSVSSFPPAAIVLLSDGAQNAGLKTPEEAANGARAENVRVNTVALGTPGGTIDRGFGGGGFGGFEQRVPVPPDPATLASISQITGGRTFTAQTEASLRSIYAKLGTSVERTRRRHEFTWVAVIVATLLLLGGATLAVLRAPRLP